VAFLKEYQKQFLFDEGSEALAAPVAAAVQQPGDTAAPMDAAEDDDDDL
jgi:hypothetical protein